jgi:phage terminase large subunit-like protein
MATIEKVVRLHDLHPKQAEIRASNAKRKVLACGRRFGKTTLAADVSIEGALVGRRILFAAPTQDQIEMFWDCCKWSLEEPLRSKHIYKNETRHLLEFPNGGVIRAKTAYNADTLRGDYADLLFLEEFAMMSFDAWDKVGAPMLLDNDGDAWFLSSPKRRNHFHRFFVRGLDDEAKRWKSWHATSHDNPYLSAEALAEITADMTDEAYRQEIMAEFLENEGAVFRNIAACMKASLKPDPKDHEGHRVVGGVDWAKQADYTTVALGCADCRAEVARDRFNKIDYAFQRGRIKALCDRWTLKGMKPHLLAESNAMGEPIIEQLRRDGVNVHGFMTTASSKPPLIENLALALERAEWQFQDDPVWTAELEAYERKVSATTGRSQYSAPEGVHDDTVIARALMLRDAGQPYGAALVDFV